MSKAAELALLIGSHSQGSTIGHKNMIINGDFMIDQKGDTHTQTGSGGMRPIDGWREGQSNVGQLSVEVVRVSDAPSGTQFKKSLRFQVKTVESSLDASEDCTILTKIEGHDCQKLMYGTSDAKSTTLSFWVKSSIAGTFAVNIYQEDGNDAISKPYTISSADTWEYKTITYPGNTLATINDDNTVGLQISWYIAAGSNNVGGSNGDVWHGYTANKFAFGHVTNTHVTTDESTFQLTGVQFEIGDIATPFEHKSFEENLAKCQRYLFVPKAKGEATSAYFGTGLYYSSTQMQVYIRPPVQMRATPTVQTSSGSNHFALFRDSAGDYIDDIALNSATDSLVGLYKNGASGTSGHAGGFLANNQNDSFIYIDSWL